MNKRSLTNTMQPDWQGALRTAGKSVMANMYQGEVLNFESPGQFFGQLTEKRWAVVRGLGRDVKRVHDDVVMLAELGLVERTESGRFCPFTSMHIDMYLETA